MTESLNKIVSLDERELARNEHILGDLLLDIFLFLLFSYFGIDTQYGVYAFGADTKIIIIIMAVISLSLIINVFIKYNSAAKSNKIEYWVNVNNLINKIYRAVISVSSISLLLGSIGLYLYITFRLAPISYMKTYAGIFFVVDMILVSSHITMVKFKLDARKVISSYRTPINRVLNLKVLRIAIIIFKHAIRALGFVVGFVLSVFIIGALLSYFIATIIGLTVIFAYTTIFILLLVFGSLFHDKNELTLLRIKGVKVM